jgi:inosine-uridine nucleoside N-ribohydrolase
MIAARRHRRIRLVRRAKGWITMTTRWPTDIIEPRQRVLCDNDYGGDPDGLVQLAHHLLCDSVDLRCVIGSSEAPFHVDTKKSRDAAVVGARRVVEFIGRDDVPVLAGPSEPLVDRSTPQPSAASDAIVAEAMRDDTTVPLFVTCGGGLTAVASAWLVEPRIAERLTLVWIGGPEHPGLASPPPGAPSVEYNTSIDLAAAQVVFNDSNLDIWQVPHDAYRQVLASRSELLTRMRSAGPLGEHLFDSLGDMARLMAGFGVHLGETYVLGDSPLVLLTALWSSFDPAPASCRWVVRPRPRFTDSGDYETAADGHPLRIFTQLDTRLLLEDLYAKLALHAAR